MVISGRIRKWLVCMLLTVFYAGSGTSAEELRLGATLSLTGAYANYGRQALEGMTLAAEEINQAGGVPAGSSVKLIVEDFGTLDLKRAVSAARKLISLDKVRVLLPLIIEDSEVIVPITSQIPLFTMAVGCGARKCGFSVGPYHVRSACSHDSIIQRLVSYAVAHGTQHACIIAAEATYFEGYGRYIEELSKKAGQRVSYVSVPLSLSEDYRDVATRFKHDQCDAIYAWLPMGTVGSFFRRVRESGSTALILSIVESDDPNVLQSAGQAAEGVVFATFSLGSPEFQKRFRERFKEPPARPALPAYDGLKLLVKLVSQVGTSPQALREAILKVKDFPAENGVMTYTAEGERLGEEVLLMQIVRGAPVEIR